MSGARWRPGATLEVLRQRARILQRIRAFFMERGVLEVETPLLGRAASTDPFLDSFSTRYHGPGGGLRYLQTSPEFAMKRLLAAGSGPIFQICKAFRNGEAGGRHNPEFTLLEWYRPGFDHHALMDEVEALIAALLGCGAVPRVSYGRLFQEHLGIDPHRAEVAELAAVARRHRLDVAGMEREGRDTWLSLLLTHLIEPNFETDRPLFVHDYPASQAMLARVREGDPPVAERFELYWGPMELANGFHELTDAAVQRARFEADLAERRARGLEAVPMDEALLDALEAGLPPCAGVALGIDRLVMAACGKGRIDEVVAFTIERA